MKVVVKKGLLFLYLSSFALLLTQTTTYAAHSESFIGPVTYEKYITNFYQSNDIHGAHNSEISSEIVSPNYETPTSDAHTDDQDLVPSETEQVMPVTSDEAIEDSDIKKRDHDNKTKPFENYSNIRPIYGILTEPLRGSLRHNSEEVADVDQYVPSSHVKFLEQAGIRVVPISFKLSKEDLFLELDKVNGIYLPGDSHQTILNDEYQQTFASILEYTKIKVKAHYTSFPVFLMGNSLQTLLMHNLKSGQLPTVAMEEFQNKNLYLRVIAEPQNTFILDELTGKDLEPVMLEGSFFNRQKTGLKLKDFQRADPLSKKFQVLATFKTEDNAAEEFIALMEGYELPLYVFTYSIEMTQFIYADPITTNIDPLDHSIASREHAQYMADQIAEEGKQHITLFQKQTQEVFKSLIRHHELATVAYSSVIGRATMPAGLEKHDVYLIR